MPCQRNQPAATMTPEARIRGRTSRDCSFRRSSTRGLHVRAIPTTTAALPPTLPQRTRKNGAPKVKVIGLGYGVANLPVQAERVDQASQSPAVLFAYREYFGRAGRQRLRENFIRVGDCQNHSDRPAAERLRA